MKMIDADALKSKIEKIQVMAFGLRCEKTLLMSALEEYRNDVIKAIEDSPSVDGWISVKERLPYFEFAKHQGKFPYDERYIDVIVMIAGAKEPTTLRFSPNDDKSKQWYSTENGYIEYYSVNHWQPLPEPPKEVDDDQ